MIKPKCIVCHKDIEAVGGCLHEAGWWHHITCPVNPDDADALYRAILGGYWE